MRKLFFIPLSVLLVLLAFNSHMGLQRYGVFLNAKWSHESSWLVKLFSHHWYEALSQFLGMTMVQWGVFWGFLTQHIYGWALLLCLLVLVGPTLWDRLHDRSTRRATLLITGAVLSLLFIIDYAHTKGLMLASDSWPVLSGLFKISIWDTPAIVWQFFTRFWVWVFALLWLVAYRVEWFDSVASFTSNLAYKYSKWRRASKARRTKARKATLAAQEPPLDINYYASFKPVEIPPSPSPAPAKKAVLKKK